MNQFLLILFLLLVCGVVYMEKQQPDTWNQFVDSLMVPGAGGTPVTPVPATTALSTNAAPAHSGPIYISPASPLIHSSHIIDVAQPDQTNRAKVYVPPNPLPSQSNWVWTTSDGRTFRNVVIEKVEADRVTIFHNEGTAVVDINLLPSEIETQLNYDPELAAQAHLVREQSADESAAASAAPAATTFKPVAPQPH